MIDENTSRQVEELYRSDDWAELRWAREHSTPQQIARHLLDPQWRNRDYNALDELVEMTHDADLSSLDEDDLETLAASGLPELRQAVIRYAGTPARLLEDMARTESNTRLLQMLVESGKLSQSAVDLCCWNQTDSRLAASMLPKASDDLLHRLSGRDWWPSRKNAVESGRLDRKDLDDMIKTENHPDVVSALIGTGEFDMDSEVNAIRRVITSPGLLTAYTNPMNRRYSLDQSRREVVRQAARTMLEHAPVGMILSMPDDDDENWRTLIDTAATEYAGELGKDMLGLIAQSEGNTQARTILAGRGFPKAAASNAERTLAASPGADGTYGFNLRLLGRLKDDVDYFLGPSHADKYLWAGSVDAQIAKLREIDGTIRPEDRPEWFSQTEDINYKDALQVTIALMSASRLLDCEEWEAAYNAFEKIMSHRHEVIGLLIKENACELLFTALVTKRTARAEELYTDELDTYIRQYKDVTSSKQRLLCALALYRDKDTAKAKEIYEATCQRKNKYLMQGEVSSDIALMKSILTAKNAL